MIPRLVRFSAWRANQKSSRCPGRVRRIVMFWFQRRSCFWPSRQQIIAIVLLVVSVAVHLPLPHSVSPGKVKKDLSRPFPCQDRPCGCLSAEHCKKKCCCFTADQKLAWARSHGVDPEEVVAQSVRPPRSNKSAPDAVKRQDCCSTTTLSKSERNRGTCGVQPSKARGGERSLHGDTAVRYTRETNRGSSSSKGTTEHATRCHVVIGVMAQECQGVAQTFSGQFVFVIPPSVSLNLLVEPTGERVLVAGSRILLPLAEPPVPPPRLMSC
jgi:hypothetical protein